GEEEEQGDQEAERRGQDQQLSLGELAERPVEQGRRAGGGVLEADGGEHDDGQEGEQQEQDGHSMPPRDGEFNGSSFRHLPPPRRSPPNWASSEASGGSAPPPRSGPGGPTRAR